jgi:hypothetical protein
MKRELRDEFALSIVNQMAKRNSYTIDSILFRILLFFGLKKTMDLKRYHIWAYKAIAQECYKFADEMIVEREREKINKTTL